MRKYLALSAYIVQTIDYVLKINNVALAVAIYMFILRNKYDNYLKLFIYIYIIFRKKIFNYHTLID